MPKTRCDTLAPGFYKQVTPCLPGVSYGLQKKSLQGEFCVCLTCMAPLTNAQIREFKARAQRMKASIKVGKEGLSAKFIAALDQALNHQELIKVKFDDFKDQKKELTPQLAEKTGSHLITRVGNVVVLYRPKPAAPPAAETD